MVKMNYNRARGGDDDYGGVGAEPTMPAKYSGTCSACGQRFEKGDDIAAVVIDKRNSYQHGHCRYPASALIKRQLAEGAVAIASIPRKPASPEKCRAVTSKGKPCSNKPQKGEQFCGPHLTQLGDRKNGPPRPAEMARDVPF